MGRTVTLVLTDRTGRILGTLPPFQVEVPWWPEVAEIVAIAQSRWGLDVAVLRVLATENLALPCGGQVTYLAEVGATGQLPQLEPVPREMADDDGRLAPHPRRAPWASPGGPAATLAWAKAVLAERGRPCVRATQRKSWNLSGLWQLDTPAGPVWIKQVPDFFGHEAAVLRWLGSVPDLAELAPGLLAADDDRMLVDHVPGEDQFGAPPLEVAAMLDDLHRIQSYAAGQLQELLALGVPDRRSSIALASIAEVVEKHAPALAPEPRSAVERLVRGLSDRLAKVDECGVPDTLVHGDFHPGNVRSDGSRRVIIDWGDSTVGHPAMDVLRATERMPAADAAALLAAWSRRWRAQEPGCEPERATELMRPVVRLQYAVVYAGFLDRIEPSEWRYHATDVPDYLESAAELVDG